MNIHNEISYIQISDLLFSHSTKNCSVKLCKVSQLSFIRIAFLWEMRYVTP